MSIIFRAGDCLDVFGAEPDESFDAFVSDWPAGVAFMSRAWDRDHGGRDAWVKVWAERAAMMRRKAKPGAYSLTWALPRTSHWTATALDDAGWQIQDVIVHVFGQGWPKGRSALKPASEHWILARNGSGGALQIDAARVARGEGVNASKATKFYGDTAEPYEKGTGRVYQYGGSWPPNLVLSHCPECEERGTRRVKGEKPRTLHNSAGCGFGGSAAFESSTVGGSDDGTEIVPAFDCLAACDCGASLLAPAGGEPPRCTCGRAMWWACPVAEMDAQSSRAGMHSAGFAQGPQEKWADQAPPLVFGSKVGSGPNGARFGDTGGASRFFPRFSYQAKAAGGERHAGCEALLWHRDPRNPFGFNSVDEATFKTCPEDERARGNVHPTVKSIALMEWLVALVLPPGGRLGDITCGSGGTGIAVRRLNEAHGLGASFLGCDICPEAIEIAEARLAWWRAVRLDVKPVRREQLPEEPPQRDLFAGIR